MIFIEGKRVAITGAGGSIGSELALRCIELDAQALLLIDNSEIALWKKQIIWLDRRSVACRLGDVRDYPRMRELFETFRPHIVFHAAALKHVPFCEQDSNEANKTNHWGTAYAATAAGDAGAEIVVLISTDKATDPVCALGRSKAGAERIMSRLNQVSETCRFASVRFHNIFGSSGSVVDRFAAQIAAGGPVTVTHPDMVRWFATPREACDLLIACAEHAVGPSGRDLYALNVGKPMNILDLAESVIGDWNAKFDRNVEISIVGIRPGERLEEKLVGEGEKEIDVGIDGIIGIERVPENASGSTSYTGGGEKSSAEGQAPAPEAA